jgi:hypothetical protein
LEGPSSAPTISVGSMNRANAGEKNLGSPEDVYFCDEPSTSVIKPTTAARRRSIQLSAIAGSSRTTPSRKQRLHSSSVTSRNRPSSAPRTGGPITAPPRGVRYSPARGALPVSTTAPAGRDGKHGINRMGRWCRPVHGRRGIDRALCSDQPKAPTTSAPALCPGVLVTPFRLIRITRNGCWPLVSADRTSVS